MLEDPERVGVREGDIGIAGFLTTTPPLGGRLKVRVDDFEVEEVGPRPLASPTGRFAAARIRLTNWETNRFVNTASDRLGVSRKKIHFSGTKDKRGITTRWFTLEAPLDRVQALSSLPGVEVLEAYATNTELELGVHHGNQFRLTLRNVEGTVREVEERVGRTWGELAACGGCPNFFGPQRFGAHRPITHRVGERMVRGDFLGAVLVYLTSPAPGEPAELAAARRRLLKTRDWKAALPHFVGDSGFERALLHRLIETQGDGRAALLALPSNLQILFVYAYQSLLFNRILSRRLADDLPLHRAIVGDLIAPIESSIVQDEWIPVTSANLDRVNDALGRGRAAVTGLLPGTQAPLAQGRMGELEQRVLAEEHLEMRDFLIPENLGWSSKGTRRALLCPVSDFSAHVDADDLHPGAIRVDFAFQLPRGSYATVALREFVKSPHLVDYG